MRVLFLAPVAVQGGPQWNPGEVADVRDDLAAQYCARGWARKAVEGPPADTMLKGPMRKK